MDLSNDFHWEVRRDSCVQLYHISKYIGANKSLEIIFPEFKELLDDEEKEVVEEALISFADHVSTVYCNLEVKA